MKRPNIKLKLDRLIYGGPWRQIGILFFAMLIVFAVVAGSIALWWGDSIGYATNPNQPDWADRLWQLYYYYVDAGNQMSMDGTPSGSRLIGFVMGTLGSIFLGGLLISTITNIIERRVEVCRQGRNYYRFADHAVIIGSEQMVLGIVKQLIESSVKRIVILTSGDVEHLRQEVQAALPNKHDRRRVIVNYGTRNSADYLQRINVTKAREVYIVGDTSEFDDIESYHDALNIECLKVIADLCQRDGREGLPCNVSFEYLATFHIFQYADLPADVTRYIDFHPFNFNEYWAQKVMVACSSPDQNIIYQPLDYSPIVSVESGQYVHLIIIGLSSMGQAMALQAAHVAHYPNYRKRKTRITIIDRDMRRRMDEFKQMCGALFDLSQSTYIDADRWVESGLPIDAPSQWLVDARILEGSHIKMDLYGHLITPDIDNDFIDIEWTFIQGDDANPRVRALLEQYIADKDAMPTVAVCLNVAHIALNAAMHLPMLYYQKGVPVLVQQRQTYTVVDTLAGSAFSDDRRQRLLYKHLRPFGMIYDCYDIRMAMSVRYCKRINAVYQTYFSTQQVPSAIDDAEAEKMWQLLPTTKQWSNVYSATTIPTKLRCLGYDTNAMLASRKPISEITEEQALMLSQMEHNRWMVEELLLGYRPVTAEEDAAIDADRTLKDEYKRAYVHYDIRPYAGLKPDAKGHDVTYYDTLLIRALPIITAP